MPFTLLSQSVFDHPAFGLDARYYAGGAGAGIAVKYLDVETDQTTDVLGHAFAVSGKRIKVRKQDLAVIRDQDVFEISGQKYYVKGDPMTVRDEWLIEFGG